MRLSNTALSYTGVADQLQTNFASDLRNILKAVFDLHTGSDTPKKEPAFPTPDRQSGKPLNYYFLGHYTILSNAPAKPETWQSSSS